MDTIEITVRVNKVNAVKVKEVGTAHNGTLEEDKTAHALAETEEPAVPHAEKIIDHEILCFTFEQKRTQRPSLRPPQKPSASLLASLGEQ